MIFIQFIPSAADGCSFSPSQNFPNSFSSPLIPKFLSPSSQPICHRRHRPDHLVHRPRLTPLLRRRRRRSLLPQPIAMMRAQEADPINLEVLLALGVSHTNELEQTAALKYLYGWLRHHPKYGTLAPLELANSLYYAYVSTLGSCICSLICLAFVTEIFHLKLFDDKLPFACGGHIFSTIEFTGSLGTRFEAKLCACLGKHGYQLRQPGLSFCWMHGPGLVEFMHSDDLFEANWSQQQSDGLGSTTATCKL
ncbi:hypothetical protein ES319_A07G147300v1 [Gossypium barbadense]|uniref:Uncharacterized protein n=1 Tax=Gossypium barbadense TaxID=3634 RepID=A0A5J5V3J4_GOSBA|nr:hypothetical protein ES319_A07G147300v1 [Gossypium barbadense]